MNNQQMSAKDREQAVKLAQAITPSEGGTANRLARGLLAEHEEVLAARLKIADMTREAQASAEFAVVNAQRFADDLAAARGVTARLRASITAGGTDAEQGWATETALRLVTAAPSDWSSVRMSRAMLALHEEHKATTTRLDAVLSGVERVIAEARGT
jgi:hypothetical protein